MTARVGLKQAIKELKSIIAETKAIRSRNLHHDDLMAKAIVHDCNCMLAECERELHSLTINRRHTKSIQHIVSSRLH